MPHKPQRLFVKFMSNMMYFFMMWLFLVMMFIMYSNLMMKSKMEN